MLNFALGAILGTLFSILVTVVVMAYRPTIERTLNQASATLKPKGVILDPENEEVEDWAKSIEAR